METVKKKLTADCALIVVMYLERQPAKYDREAISSSTISKSLPSSSYSLIACNESMKN